MFTEKQINRLWSNVEVSGPDECWNWKRSVYWDGYGKVKIGGVMYQPHRVVKMLETEIPKGLEVMHACDNRRCCNPAHLQLGTHKDNMADMVRKGRRRNGVWKLKMTQVLADQLRADFAGGFSRKGLARKYNISPAHTRDILKGIYWTEGTPPPVQTTPPSG